MTEQTGSRRFARLSAALPVTARAAQFRQTDLRGTVRDIGAGGVMAEFPVQIVAGSSLRFVIHARSGTLQKEGTVVWTDLLEGRVRHGISFLNPEDPQFAVNLSGATPSPRRSGPWP